LLGILFAMPAAAALRILLLSGIQRYQQSEFYHG